MLSERPPLNSWWLSNPYWGHHSPEMASFLDSSFRLHRVLVDHVQYSFPPADLPAATLRERLAAASLMITLDHFYGSVVAVTLKTRSSAFALWRSVAESFVRGAWLANVAKDQQVQHLINGGETLKIDAMLRYLSKHPSYDNGVLSSFIGAEMKAMHGFAHGDLRQESRWIGDEYIESRHDDEDTIALLSRTAMLAALAASELLGLLRLEGDEMLAEAYEFMPRGFREGKKPS